MKFTKMQGCGNDYVYINGAEVDFSPEKKVEIVKKLSDRHFGVGGDGVIFINPSDQADFEMEMYNADGSRGEMCGNGIRCVAVYVYCKGLTDKKEFCIISAGKIKKISLDVDENSQTRKVNSVCVDMGLPVLESEITFIPVCLWEILTPSSMLMMWIISLWKDLADILKTIHLSRNVLIQNLFKL